MPRCEDVLCSFSFCILSQNGYVPSHDAICMNNPLTFSPPHESRALPKIRSLRLDFRSCIPFGFHEIPKIQFVQLAQISLRKHSVSDASSKSSTSGADGIKYPIDTPLVSTVTKEQ